MYMSKPGKGSELLGVREMELDGLINNYISS
jgi:hypothetical protein